MTDEIDLAHEEDSSGSHRQEDFTGDKPPDPAFRTVPVSLTKPFDLEENREGTRGDLARGLLYLLTFAIGGVLVFIGTGRLEGTVLTQSVFPSLIALAGTALGFYFGSQSTKDNGKSSVGPASPPKVPTTKQPNN